MSAGTLQYKEYYRRFVVGLVTNIILKHATDTNILNACDCNDEILNRTERFFSRTIKGQQAAGKLRRI